MRKTSVAVSQVGPAEIDAVTAQIAALKVMPAPDPGAVNEWLQDGVLRGLISPHQLVRIAPILRPFCDPSGVVIPCEVDGCPLYRPLRAMHSMAVVYRMPGEGKAPYQCPHEQHFGCSHEHAVRAMLACAALHIGTGDHAP